MSDHDREMARLATMPPDVLARARKVMQAMGRGVVPWLMTLALPARKWLWIDGAELKMRRPTDERDIARWRGLVQNPDVAARTYQAIQWSDNGFPVVEPDPKYAASLMCTSFSDASGIRLPWESFLIKVPPKTLSMVTDFSPTDVDYILIRRAELGRIHLDMLGLQKVQDMTFVAGCSHPATSIADLVEAPEDQDWAAERPSGGMTEMTDHDWRALRLAARLVLGVIADMMTSPRGQGVRTASLSERIRIGGEAAHPSFFKLTRPVQIDCRVVARDYVVGGGKSPTVRSLVRGHWRNQVHGPANALRKWIHIEPFWRGPEGAPVAVRPHRIGAP